jgi:glycosyltransferase involved in cell wall biosynthesis
MKRPKICHIIHDGSGGGGGATFALAYFPAYNADFETFVITGKDGNLAERLRARGVRTVTLSMSRPWRCLLSWPRLRKIVREEKPDAVIVHGQWGGFFGSLAARLAGVKTLLYYTHFPSFYTDWDLFRVIRNRIAEEVTCRLVSRVVCLSQGGRYQYLLRRFTSDSKFIHISNGLDPAALTESLERDLLLREISPVSPIRSGSICFCAPGRWLSPASRARGWPSSATARTRRSCTRWPGNWISSAAVFSEGNRTATPIFAPPIAV